MSLANYLVVGKFGKPFSLNGYISVISYTEPKSNIFDYQSLYVDQSQIFFESYKLHKKHFLVKIVDIHSINQVQSMVGKVILIDRSELSPVDEDEYYWDDLIGMQVFNQSSLFLGKVKSIMPTPAHGILVISHHQDVSELFIPFVGRYIQEVRTQQNQILVDW